MKIKTTESPLLDATFTPLIPPSTTHFYKQIRQKEQQIEKDKLQISPHNSRRDRALRKRLETNPDNTVPGKTSLSTFIPRETINAPDGHPMNPLKSPPQISDQED
jgi:hypothetical protein